MQALKKIMAGVSISQPLVSKKPGSCDPSVPLDHCGKITAGRSNPRLSFFGGQALVRHRSKRSMLCYTFPRFNRGQEWLEWAPHQCSSSMFWRAGRQLLAADQVGPNESSRAICHVGHSQGCTLNQHVDVDIPPSEFKHWARNGLAGGTVSVPRLSSELFVLFTSLPSHPPIAMVA